MKVLLLYVIGGKHGAGHWTRALRMKWWLYQAGHEAELCHIHDLERGDVDLADYDVGLLDVPFGLECAELAGLDIPIVDYRLMELQDPFYHAVLSPDLVEDPPVVDPQDRVCVFLGSASMVYVMAVAQQRVEDGDNVHVVVSRFTPDYKKYADKLAGIVPAGNIHHAPADFISIVARCKRAYITPGLLLYDMLYLGVPHKLVSTTPYQEHWAGYLLRFLPKRRRVDGHGHESVITALERHMEYDPFGPCRYSWRPGNTPEARL